MDIKFDTIDFQSVFSAAIMQALDQQKRDILIKGAMEGLFTKDQYSKKNPLQQAFDQAMYTKVVKEIEQLLDTNEEVKEAIHGLIRDAVIKINSDSREKTVGKIAEKIIEGLYSEKY